MSGTEARASDEERARVALCVGVLLTKRYCVKTEFVV